MKMKKNYCEILEAEALEQFNNCCNHIDFVQGALMPDAHTGYSLCIGGVIGLKNTIVPAWVGYDIGCGMCAINTKITLNDINQYKQLIYKKIKEAIPMGEKYNTIPSKEYSLNFSKTKLPQLCRREIEYQIGTLGGGNHFIEIDYDKKENIWIVIHSGSRGIGWKIADAYMSFDKKEQGFSLESDIGNQYIIDQNFCLEFALQNRMLMLKRIEEVFKSIIDYKIKFDWDKVINRNHNHAVKSHNMIIHRKGATHAEKGMLGVIPGNMKDGSFIIEGLGNSESLWSSSHGAGRVLSRVQAGKEIKLEDFKNSMEGIICEASENTKDESVFAYKNIFDVIRIQEEQGLIKVLNYLKPIINFKS
jgi:tRNA-splicing ligase RtcB